MKVLWTFIVAAWISVSAQESRLVFDVASIKENKTAGGAPSRQLSPESLIYRDVGMSEYVEMAFGVPLRRITGPAWIYQDRFDIEARTSLQVSEREMRLMLRSLLEDRFKLQFHRETKVSEAEAVRASIPSALQNLGLKLESQKAMAEFITIDRMERLPTEN